MKINLHKTRTGKPGIWESGGMNDCVGLVVLVANYEGLPKVPVFIRKDHKNGTHALFIAKKGMLVCQGSHIGPKYVLRLGRIADIICTVEMDVPVAVLDTVKDYVFSTGEKPYLGTDYEHLCEAAVNKLDCSYCVNPHYLKHNPDHDQQRHCK